MWRLRHINHKDGRNGTGEKSVGGGSFQKLHPPEITITLPLLLYGRPEVAAVEDGHPLPTPGSQTSRVKVNNHVAVK